jgi:hypothetical protein
VHVNSPRFDYRGNHQSGYRPLAKTNLNFATAMDHRNSPIVAKIIFILVVAALGAMLIPKIVGDTAEWFAKPLIRALAQGEIPARMSSDHQAAAVLLK